MKTRFGLLAKGLCAIIDEFKTTKDYNRILTLLQASNSWNVRFHSIPKSYNLADTKGPGPPYVRSGGVFTICRESRPSQMPELYSASATSSIWQVYKLREHCYYPKY